MHPNSTTVAWELTSDVAHHHDLAATAESEAVRGLGRMESKNVRVRVMLHCSPSYGMCSSARWRDQQLGKDGGEGITAMIGLRVALTPLQFSASLALKQSAGAKSRV